MNGTIYHFITTVRYGGIFLLMMLFPAETVMVLAGYVAGSGGLSLWLVVAAGTAGSVLGSTIIYAFARAVDPQLFYSSVERHGRLIGLRRANIERAARWFTAHARATVFAGRFLPALRTAVSIPAGFERMKLPSFLGWTLLGSAIDSFLLAYLGYAAKDNINHVFNVLTSAANYVNIVVIVLIIGFIYWRGRTKADR